jgi:hypothetical protein
LDLHTSYIAPYHSRLTFMHTLDYVQVEPESGVQEEQVTEVFGDRQVSSYEDTNIVVMKTSPGASNHHP